MEPTEPKFNYRLLRWHIKRLDSHMPSLPMEIRVSQGAPGLHARFEGSDHSGMDISRLVGWIRDEKDADISDWKGGEMDCIEGTVSPAAMLEQYKKRFFRRTSGPFEPYFRLFSGGRKGRDSSLELREDMVMLHVILDFNEVRGPFRELWTQLHTARDLPNLDLLVAIGDSYVFDYTVPSRQLAKSIYERAMGLNADRQ